MHSKDGLDSPITKATRAQPIVHPFTFTLDELFFRPSPPGLLKPRSRPPLPVDVAVEGGSGGRGRCCAREGAQGSATPLCMSHEFSSASVTGSPCISSCISISTRIGLVLGLGLVLGVGIVARAHKTHRKAKAVRRVTDREARSEMSTCVTHKQSTYTGATPPKPSSSSSSSSSSAGMCAYRPASRSLVMRT